MEQEMSQIVWSSMSIDMFERDWEAFITKYGLTENKWLSDLYEDCFLWVPVYLDINFWVGMRSTQRRIEVQFQEAYTHAKFREVQAQFRGKINCQTTLRVRDLESYTSAEEASEFEVLTAKYHLALDKLDAEMKEFKAKLKENPTIIHEDGFLNEINNLQSPPHVRSKGRPRKRLGSNTEKKIASATNRKKRKAV
ncbi:hypothetical protein PIB30_029669 [Stylosanthes scabra]|uniref:Protein FAR1-RELATED SEQUENCE n=1 Tax=Stylosanthes scabra TaxID=79078 RepID=A0ABU6TBM6_9FABA|nr:hypothetical protein [Stylosanthes scabra]